MALTAESAVKQAADLLAKHDATLDRDAHKGLVSRYLAGEHDLPYMPKGAKAEYRALAGKSITNWLPLISDTFAKGLFVDGYRPAKVAENARPWDYWQANGLDARQTIAHRGALEFGESYVLVLPGSPAPIIRPLSPKRTFALYADPDDEWPVFALITDGKTDRQGERIFRLLDSEGVWTLTKPKDQSEPVVTGYERHGLGVTPMVRFRDRLDGDAVGIILPLLTLQNRVNESVFTLLIALQYASFRQRWATGLAIPTAPVLDENGVPTGEEAPVEPFQAAVDRLWVTDSPEAKFGDFAQTETSGHLNNYKSAVQSLAAIAQTPPHVLLGDLVNLSADALAAAEASTQRKIAEYETIFGEAWEQTLRLAAAADGDAANAADTSAQVRWRDTEARSLAATVDALGKMAQMLQVPVEGLWERIPGVTETDVEAWREMAGRADGMALLAQALNRQAAPNPALPGADAAATPEG